MWVYLLNALTIPIYAKVFRGRKLFVIVVALQLFLILALRSVSLGVDLPNYAAGYEYIKSLSFEDLMPRLHFFQTADLVYPFDYESGYTVLNWLVAHLGFNFHGFLVVCAAICIGGVSWFIYRYSKKPWLSFIIFSCFGFFAYDFGIIRQSLALSMFLMSYILFDRKRRIAGTLSFVTAFLFHRTAIIGLPLFFVSRLKIITKKKFLGLLSLSIPILVLSAPIYNSLIVNVMSLMEKGGYSGHDAVLNNMVILLLCISIIVLVFYNFAKIKDKISSIACYALVFAVFFSIFGLYNDYFARALSIYSIFLTILIPDVLDQYRGQKLSFVITVSIYLLLFGFMCYNIGGSAIDPYVFNEGGFLW